MPPCSHLVCPHCDHAVIMLPHRQWDAAAVDYFFFRNAVPDAAKLTARTVASPGAAAFCCQCAWISIPPGAVANLTAAQAAGGVPVYRQEREAALGQLKWGCGLKNRKKL